MRSSRLFLQHNPFYLRRFFCLFILISILAVPVTAQVVTDTIPPPPIDTLTVPDSSISQTDTIVVEQIVDLVSKRPLQLFPQWKVDQGISFSLQVLNHHPYFNFNAAPVIPHSDFKNFRGKEILFYVLITLVLIFALFKLAFAKYFNDLFRVFFRTTLKQRQIREQLMQSPLPSLAFNIFFVATTGLYIAFLLFYYFKKNPVENFWLLYFYCSVGISIIYIVKFAGLKIFGWLFNMKRATEAYTFIVFIINKVIGIFLLPVVVLLAVAGHEVFLVVLVLSWCGIGILLLYRLILGYAVIRNEVRFNLFYFLLYMVSFEIAPLILIYKLLVLVF